MQFLPGGRVAISHSNGKSGWPEVARHGRRILQIVLEILLTRFDDLVITEQTKLLDQAGSQQGSRHRLARFRLQSESIESGSQNAASIAAKLFLLGCVGKKMPN